MTNRAPSYYYDPPGLSRLTDEDRAAIRAHATRVLESPQDDAYWNRLCDQSPDALARYDLPEAKFVTGVTICPLCLRDTDGESSCLNCLSSIDPELTEWL